MSATPIADHALISDCRSMALVDRTGSIEWLCWPRVDAPSVFGRLLDADAGHWSIARSMPPSASTRRYLDADDGARDDVHDASGTVDPHRRARDGTGERGHELGRRSPRLLVRRLSGVSGTVEVVIDLAARPEYGLVTPVVVAVDGGVRLQGGPAVMVLSSPVSPRASTTAASTATLHARGGRRGVLRRCTIARTDEPPPRVWTRTSSDRRLDDTIATWRSWSRLHQRYEGPWRDLVHHSGRVLQALTFAPTGAIVAARRRRRCPRSVGGDRNWDYRYSLGARRQLHDEALWVAACPDEADDFFAFMATAAAAAGRAEAATCRSCSASAASTT